MGKFSLDTLGVDGQSFEDKESVFVNPASRISQTSKMDQFKIFGAMLIPGMAKMMRLMGINTFKPKETMFFANIAIQQQKASKERKDDLIDLMLDAMEGLKDEGQEENEAV